MGGFALVFLGQDTHVGKYAVWGNGRYEIIIESCSLA
jgi:hypothetical protein